MTGFRGVFPAIITPMTQDGRVNEAAFREVLEFNIRGGVHGFWVAGGTGEGVLLDDDENRRIAEIAVDQNRGRTKLIMHVGAPTTQRSVAMAEHAARAGVEAICAVPPFFYRSGDAAVVEHYRAVGAAAGLPLFVYNLPQSTNVEITPELMCQLQDSVPQLTGLKHSSLLFANIRTFADMGLSCFTGNSVLLLPALTIGASGIVDGPPCAAPEKWVAIWDAYNAGDLERAEEAQLDAHRLFEAALGFGMHVYFATLHAIVSERLGIDCGSPRPPLPALTAAQRAAVAQKVVALGLSQVPVSA